MQITSHNFYATALQGLQRAEARVSDAAAHIARGDLEPGRIVELKQGELAFQANVEVLEVAKATSERLLDVRV